MIHRSTYNRAIVRMFFTEAQNTAQIARKLNLDEWRVDSIVSAEMDRRWKFGGKS